MPLLLTVIGTRPQYIKYAALSPALRNVCDEFLVDSGQHYDDGLSGNFLSELHIPRPHVTLDAPRHDSIPQLSSMIDGIAEVIRSVKPHATLCFGDTNSTLAAALASLKCGVEIIHVEAGERAFTLDEVKVPPHSIPEEGNRVIVDHVSSLLLCASERGFSNLISESVTGAIYFTGDILYDLFLRNRPAIDKRFSLLEEMRLEPGEYYYCTIHRAVNTDSRERLESIVEAFELLDRTVVFPVHPRTERLLMEYGILDRLARSESIRILPPSGYIDSLVLSRFARKVITDSGGVMREAFFNGVRSVCVDDSTAWIELCTSGWSELSGPGTAAIIQATHRETAGERPNFFGDGSAVERSVEAIRKFLFDRSGNDE